MASDGLLREREAPLRTALLEELQEVLAAPGFVPTEVAFSNIIEGDGGFTFDIEVMAEKPTPASAPTEKTQEPSAKRRADNPQAKASGSHMPTAYAGAKATGLCDSRKSEMPLPASAAAAAAAGSSKPVARSSSKEPAAAAAAAATPAAAGPSPDLTVYMAKLKRQLGIDATREAFERGVGDVKWLTPDMYGRVLRSEEQEVCVMAYHKDAVIACGVKDEKMYKLSQKTFQKAMAMV